MRIVQVGLDKTTLAFLRDNGIVIEDTGVLEDVEELEHWISQENCEAVVIDLSTSKFGVFVARHFRKKKINTPIVGISPTTDRPWPEERAIFLENGGDDLLRGPPNPRELVASLRAVSRRFHGASMNICEFRFGDALLKANLTTRTVFINGRTPNLTPSEQGLLLYMASNPGRILSKDALHDTLYSLKSDNPPEIKIIDVFICKIRTALGEMHPDAEKIIETVWGRGYRLTQESTSKAA